MFLFPCCYLCVLYCMCCLLSSQIQPFFHEAKIFWVVVFSNRFMCAIFVEVHTHTPSLSHPCEPFDNAIACFPVSSSRSFPFRFFLSIYACTYFVSVYKRWFDTYKSGVFVCCRSPFVLVYLDFYDDAPLVSVLSLNDIAKQTCTIHTHTCAHKRKNALALSHTRIQCAKAIWHE